MAATLHIHLLDDFRLSHDDSPVSGFNTPRLQTLLAYLVLHRAAPQSRQHIAFLFWPDSTETQARTNLRHLIHQLRKLLPDADVFLHVDTQTLLWRPEALYTLDVADFERSVLEADKATDPALIRQHLEKAVSLYRGNLLPSCYDEWLLAERERLQQRFVSSLNRLIEHLEIQRDYQAAIGYAQRLLQHDPLLETTYRRLIHLHALNGDRAAALRVYHTCATTLERELEVEPSPATRAMVERLLSVDVAQPAPVPLTRVSPMVGRDQAWVQIRQAWRRASSGQPALLLLAGEAGIGKTRLAEELVDSLSRQGIPAAVARCYVAAGGLAYAPVVDWLRRNLITAACAPSTTCGWWNWPASCPNC